MCKTKRKEYVGGGGKGGVGEPFARQKERSMIGYVEEEEYSARDKKKEDNSVKGEEEYSV